MEMIWWQRPETKIVMEGKLKKIKLLVAYGD
jgi:hypothetical protein